MPDIPSSPTDLTAVWIDHALHESGVLTASHVVDAQHMVIGEGAGVLGQLARVALTYDSPESGAPATLIAKMPIEAIENRQLAVDFGFYDRELGFYEGVAADTCPFGVPRCYYLARGEGVGEFVILLEDLGHLEAGDQVAGATLEQARVVMTALARLHAAWWDSPDLDDLGYLPYLDAPDQITAIEAFFAPTWEPCLENFGDSLSDHVRTAIENVATNAGALMHRIQESPAANTYTHGDPRLDNMFFGGADQPVAILDWQLSWRTSPGRDLSWFLGQSLEPELRAAHEDALIDLYLAELASSGVATYSRDQLWEDYGLHMLLCLSAPVIVLGGPFDMANERGNQLGLALMRRNAAAIDQHEFGDLL